MSGYRWVLDIDDVDWEDLSSLYRIAPLGEKPPESLEKVFGNSMFTCLVYENEVLVGAGRAIADGLDCAYIADVAVHPEHQGRGLGRAIIGRLTDLAGDHSKIILYANPGKEGFYLKLGFLPMNTAMGIWKDRDKGLSTGVLRETI